MNGDKLTAEKRIHVDTTPPTVTDGTPARGPDKNGWYNHPVEFAFPEATPRRVSRAPRR